VKTPDRALLELVEDWIDGDPDPETQAELRRLIADGDLAELSERMAGNLEFGTAGLRGVMGGGSARMNRAVVIRATYGLGQYLLLAVQGASERPVVVGYDARHRSRQFAEDASGVLAALGLKVRYFPTPAPTPLAAYALLWLNASAAIVITASHNPAEYNGYKVYAENGVQITPPMDTQIAELIRKAPSARSVARQEPCFSGASSFCTPLGAEVFDRYLSGLAGLRPRTATDRRIKIAYTPLHGIGAHYAERALRDAGFEDLVLVLEQAQPDPEFPTAPFPNPEEPGTLDLIKALAGQVGADLAIINDPDADRLCICLPTEGGRFAELGGNQIGVLLADFLLEHAEAEPRPLVVSTVVSSPMLASVARAHHARFEPTLTGFKWICSAGIALERQDGVRFLFGYEEAYGYALPLVRDKDGISAAVLFAELAAWCKARGRSVREYLDALYRQHGLWVSRQRSVILRGQSGEECIRLAMQRLGQERPTELGGHRVARSVDYRAGAEQRPPWLGVAPLVELALEGGDRVLVRPSGTEPKLKIYVDCRRSLSADDEVRASEAALVPEADAISEHLVGWLGLG
jgi:phosphomannomutase